MAHYNYKQKSRNTPKYKCYSVIDACPDMKDNLKYEDNIYKLNHDLIEVYNKISLKPEEKALRDDIYERFKNVIEIEFKKEGYENVSVEKYGSFQTGLMVGQSDIDVTIIIKETKEDVNLILKKCNKILLKHDLCMGEIVHIKKTRIPIIKCVDKKYGVSIDISVNQEEGILSGDFVINKLKEYPDLEYLCILYKYFLKRRNLSMCFIGGLGAYAQFLLILNFMQLHPLSDVSNIKENIGTYLMDFFLYYATFDHTLAIIDPIEQRYKTNTVRNLFIADPVSDGLSNVAVNCSQFDRIKQIMYTSYKIMAKAMKADIKNKDICALWFKFDTKELYERSENIKKYNKNK